MRGLGELHRDVGNRRADWQSLSLSCLRSTYESSSSVNCHQHCHPSSSLQALLPNTASLCPLQARLTQRALELLALPDDGQPRLLLDLGCGSGLSGENLTEQGHHWVVSSVLALTQLTQCLAAQMRSGGQTVVFGCLWTLSLQCIGRLDLREY